MKRINCFILKSEIVNIEGVSEGEQPHYLLQVDSYNESTDITDSKILYLTDIIDDTIDDTIINTLEDAEIILKDDTTFEIDVNHSNRVFVYTNGVNIIYDNH